MMTTRMSQAVVTFYLSVAKRVEASIGPNETFGEYFRMIARNERPGAYGADLGGDVYGKLMEYADALYVRQHSDPTSITQFDLSHNILRIDIRDMYLRDLSD
jgi:hypothetical protein